MPRLRSVLYVPADNQRALAKAVTLPADALIVDLEDAVSPDAKVNARQRIRDVLSTRDDRGQLVAVRINAADTPWHSEDLAAAISATPDAIVIPKVVHPADVTSIVRVLDAAGSSFIQVWAMLETTAGVLNAAAIAGASPRLTTLVVGTNDLAAELGVRPGSTRMSLLTSLGLCVLAARATGRLVLDGVFNDLTDTEGLAAECQQGMELGFDGKTLIHPSQIDLCNAAWTPTDEETRRARSLLTTWDAAERAGKAVAVHEGQMVERMHVEAARRILRRASSERQ